MSHPPARETRGSDHYKRLKLGFAEAVEIDVRYCDLVTGQAGESKVDLRFRGYRARTTEMIQLYCDLEMIESALLRAGVLREPIANASRVTPQNTIEVKLENYALTIGKEHRERGSWAYTVQGRDDKHVQQWVRAIEEVHAHVVPKMVEHGYAVGGQEVTQIAGDLVRRRRQQP